MIALALGAIGLGAGGETFFNAVVAIADDDRRRR